MNNSQHTAGIQRPFNLTDWLSDSVNSVAVTDRNGLMICCNRLFSELLPVKAGDDLLHCLHECYENCNSKLPLSSFAETLQDSRHSHRMLLRQNEQTRLELIVYPQLGQSGEVELWLWEFFDVHQALRLQEHAAHTEKMNAISRLAGGMAHEFNNLLTAVLGNLELIRARGQQGDGQLLPNVEAAEGAALRASQLISDLRRFASRSTPAREQQLVVPIVRNAQRILHGIAPPSVSISLQDETNGLELAASVNADVLSEALLKLGVNAIEAMADGSGVVRISVGVQESAEELEPQLRILVEDTGCGMPAAVRQRAFEPFFTTKDPTTAAGLGMAMAYSLIEEMDGRIDIEKSDSSGTRIAISLPLTSALPRTSSDNSVEEAHASRRLRIAVVDNNAGIREVGKGMFRHLGHDALTFPSGPRLLDRLDAGENFDLVLLDNAMPSMSGRTTYAEIRKMNTTIPVVICSGRPVELNSFAADGCEAPDGFLAKPFTLTGLVTLLNSLELEG